MNVRPTDWERAAESRIADLRKRLLDLTNANRLLNFRFRDRSRSYVRLIEAVPNVIFTKLIEGEQFQFKSLPEKTDEPPDEKTDRFLMTLEQARLSDVAYRDELNSLDDDPEGKRTLQIERRLKDRVRTQLSLPPLSNVKEMSLAEYARLHSINPSFDLPAKETDHDKKGILQVLQLPDQMERSLSGISDQAKTALQEKGVNTLCVAFGYLEWYESDTSEKVMYAPLLLQPVDIDRKLVNSNYQYRIASLGEEIDINVTLSERLTRDFGLKLPEFDEADTPESYFAKFEKIIEGHRRWRVRRFAVVGHFAFARLVMYNDIDPKLWPGSVGIVGNSNILKLFAGSEGDGQETSFFAEEYEIDEPTISRKVPLLITEADSSQFSAIVDVMDKKNIALRGPPGTGKSQTITNIIAAALDKGLRVLFVAEKMAALDVVKDRLTKAGLGSFCFELHSTRSHKKELLASLEARLEIQNKFQPPTQLESSLEELEKLRAQLTDYVTVVNKEFGFTGKTIHRILWAEQSTRLDSDSLPKKLDEVRLPDSDALTESALETRRMKLDALGGLHQSIIESHGAVERHPWHGIEAVEVNLFDQEDIVALAIQVAVACETFAVSVRELNGQLGAQTVSNLAAAERIVLALKRLPIHARDIDKTPLGSLGKSDVREALNSFLASLERRSAAANKLSTFGRVETIRANPAGLRLLDEAARKFELGTHTIASLIAYTESIRTELDEWEVVAKPAGKLLDAFGLARERVSLSTVRRALAAISQISKLPKSLLGMRDVRLMRQGADTLLGEGADRSKAIALTLAEIETRFVLVDGEDPGALRDHAEALRSSGVLGFMSSAVRDAKRKYKSLSKNPGSVPADRMANELHQIADLLGAINAFESDTNLRTLCGSQFQGIRTRFDDLMAVRRWLIETDATAGDSDIDRQIVKVLLSQTSEALLKILQYAEQPSHAILGRLLNTPSSPEESIESRIDALNKRLKVCETARALSSKLELFDQMSFARMPEAVECVESLIRAADEIQSNKIAHDALGAIYSGETTDGKILAEIINLAEGIVGSGLPEGAQTYLFSSQFDERMSRLHELLDDLGSAAENVKLTWSQFQQKAAANETIFFGAKIEENEVSRLLDRLRVAITNQNDLATWIEYCRAWKDCADVGLMPLLDAFDFQFAAVSLRKALNRVYYRSLARAMFERHPGLTRMRGVSLRQARERFQELDRKILELHQQSLAAKLSRSRVDPGQQTPLRKDYTGVVLIRHELSKKQRHLPVRLLLERAGRSIQQMKPCFMMSPLSVAQFLKPGGLRFDLLVIDEASQMRPEEALGSIARADQLAIVGDPMQLPPTSFFDVADQVVDSDEAEEIVDSESILDLSLSTYSPPRALRWHYRSRHESLIAFSNRRFYEDKLIVFPSPLDPDKARREPKFGVFHHFVEGKYKSSLNLPEAQVVAEAAVGFMREHPDRSLGVVTLNQPQREILLGEIDRLIARDRRAANYIEKWEKTLEPFFVKNLENVQGDERDVIFISTVYGPDAETGVVMNRFGPVNSNVGHRRLNVLFTRAKQRVDLFTSMRSGDIKISDSSSRGIKELRSYLEYAETGKLEQGEQTGREPDSEFEIFVRDRLLERGFEVAHQVGVAGYSIDLAVKHPRRSGYLLGIECDGATYHSSKSARDRDRLREEVLIGLKWNIYRIWSTDWFSNPQHEFTRLLAHIEKLLSAEGTTY